MPKQSAAGLSAPGQAPSREKRKKKKGAGTNDLVSYLVSYGSPKEFLEWLKQARSGPNLLLPNEVHGMPIWDVFKGAVAQQRLWTFGSNLVDDVMVTTQEPFSLKDGVMFTSCAAGEAQLLHVCCCCCSSRPRPLHSSCACSLSM